MAAWTALITVNIVVAPATPSASVTTATADTHGRDRNSRHPCRRSPGIFMAAAGPMSDHGSSVVSAADAITGIP
jgi:hypothetical protein